VAGHPACGVPLNLTDAGFEQLNALLDDGRYEIAGFLSSG
jgi:hypothetical protein